MSDSDFELFGQAADKMLRSKAFLEVFIKLIAEEYRRNLLEIADGNSIRCFKNGREQRLERNKKIKAQFRGNNHAELSREFGLTHRQIRNICKK